jgi:hypothetical protein
MALNELWTFGHIIYLLLFVSRALSPTLASCILSQSNSGDHTNIHGDQFKFVKQLTNTSQWCVVRFHNLQLETMHRSKQVTKLLSVI